MVEWLKHHVEPHSKVKEYMTKTSINRAAWIKENPQLSITDILKEHPRLFDVPSMVSIVRRKSTNQSKSVNITYMSCL